MHAPVEDNRTKMGIGSKPRQISQVEWGSDP